MTVVSVLLGAAVEVGVGSNPPSPSKSASLFLYHIYNIIRIGTEAISLFNSSSYLNRRK